MRRERRRKHKPLPASDLQFDKHMISEHGYLPVISRNSPPEYEYKLPFPSRSVWARIPSARAHGLDQQRPRRITVWPHPFLRADRINRSARRRSAGRTLGRINRSPADTGGGFSSRRGGQNWRVVQVFEGPRLMIFMNAIRFVFWNGLFRFQVGTCLC